MPDIYTRTDDMINYQPDLLEVDDDLSLLVLQLENLLFTQPRKVLGSSNFGIDLEGMLFNLMLNESYVQGRVTTAISNFCPLRETYQIDVKVNFYQGEVSDIGEVLITVDGTKAFSILVS
jgi:hypothetical protein